MKKILLFISFITCYYCVNGQNNLDGFNNLEVSVLTCGQGDMLYSLFGHSALRIKDSERNYDVVYNWGTFDFDTPGFGIKFLRGQLPYALSVTTYNAFIQEYLRDERDVIEQIIIMSNSEKDALIKNLGVNMIPYNRYYKYDFYFDNCTTRIKDLIEGIKDTLAYGPSIKPEVTFRQLLHENLLGSPWTKFGMDIILGTLSDRQAGVEDQMFLPAYYMNYLSDAESNSEMIVQREDKLLEFDEESTKKQFWSPFTIFSILLIIELLGFFLFYIAGDRGMLKFFDRLWFILISIACLVFIFMWLATDHLVCRDNWNVLWAAPWALLYFNTNKSLKRLCYILTTLASLAIFSSPLWLPQYLAPEVFLIASISLLKAARLLGATKWIDRFKKTLAIGLTMIMFSIPSYGQEKIGGITLVAPPSEFESDPFIVLKKVNANWVALVPYGFSRQEQPEVRFGSKRQWWGERIEGISKSIELAKQNGFKVMLKPQVWIPGGWVGAMDFDTEEEWRTWEETYSNYIMTFLRIAVKYDVEIFCIGTEYRISSRKREQFWRSLIKLIRSEYRGKLTYSANWDSYEEIPFWDALDFVGISAYFPLSEMDTPPSIVLDYKWRKYVRKLERFSKKKNLPILFTEYGYLSVDGAAGKTWELEKNIRSRSINEVAQANSYNALLKVFSKRKFWAGGFLWKWFPEGRGHEGYPERDYTPQNKIAEKTISDWYGKF